ncbi:hypothetical protein L6303_00790 [archaeon]|nr:hypothetical protein [Nanoarchaeota archaeon]MBU4300915.1 hypothetical protein [Nanoarchaeota archaeon]MBU4451757.1 hypothetical protein [Nanoarchaeota archaeon]MCG2723262.1 hypothetical protein [archaeon]
MCLKIKLKTALNNAFSFSSDARRISVMFSVIATSCFAIFFSLISFLSYLPTKTVPFVNMAQLIPNYAGNLLLISILFAFVISLSAVLSILVKGAFIHNYTIRDSKEGVIKSINLLGGRMLPLINLTIAIILVSLVLESIMFFGWILSVLFSLVVFFAYQEVVIAEKGVVESIRNSYLLLKDGWKEVLVSIIVIILISSVIVVAFFIPFIFALFGGNLLLIIMTGAISVVGLSIANLFSNGFTTDVYLQLKDKKPETAQDNIANEKKTSAVVRETKKSATKRKTSPKKRRKKKRK